MAKKRFCDACDRMMTDKEAPNPRTIRLENNRGDIRMVVKLKISSYTSNPEAKMGQVCETTSDHCSRCVLARLNELLTGKEFTVHDFMTLKDEEMER